MSDSAMAHEEEHDADDAEPEPQVEHDVVGVGDVSTGAGAGLVVLELHAQTPADDQVLGNQGLRLGSQVQAVLGRFRLRLAVEEALEVRGERDPRRLPVDRGRHDHDDR